MVRKGQRLAVEVALRAAPQAGKDDVRNLSGTHPFDGARVANIVPAVADELGLDEQEGVVILSVRQNSRAARIGFQPGDIIQQVGREKIETVSELEACSRSASACGWWCIKRGGQTIRLQLAGYATTRARYGAERPRAFAARCSVSIVTLPPSGSSSRSSCARLVFINSGHLVL